MSISKISNLITLPIEPESLNFHKESALPYPAAGAYLSSNVSPVFLDALVVSVVL